MSNPQENKPTNSYGASPDRSAANQQPNAYQQPYGGQQPNACQQQYGQQPNGQPPYGYPPQQPYYGQQPYYPPQPQTAPQPQILAASPAEKDAAFSSASTAFMLVLCIIGTLNLISTLIGDILSLNISGLLLFVLDILIVVGTWVTFANAKKKKLSSKGISLIRVPYIIQYVFSVFSFVTNLIVWILTLNIVSLLIGLVTFVFQCICFSSVNKTLKLARDIYMNKSVAGRKSGSFAAVMMIISASLTLISEIVGFVMLESIKAALQGSGMPSFIMTLLGTGGIITVVVSVVSFLVNISGAVVMLQFGKKIKQING